MLKMEACLNNVDKTKIFDYGGYMNNSLTPAQQQVAEQVYREYISPYLKGARPKGSRLNWLNRRQVYEAVAGIFNQRVNVGTVEDVAAPNDLEELREMAQEAGVTVRPQDTKREIARRLGARQY